MTNTPGNICCVPNSAAAVVACDPVEMQAVQEGSKLEQKLSYPGLILLGIEANGEVLGEDSSEWLDFQGSGEVKLSESSKGLGIHTDPLRLSYRHSPFEAVSEAYFSQDQTISQYHWKPFSSFTRATTACSFLKGSDVMT